MQKQNTRIIPIKQFTQELLWKSIYTCLSLGICFCICFNYADVFLFYHASICFKVLPNIIPSFLTLDVTEALQSMFLISLFICSMCMFPFIYYFIITFILPSCFKNRNILYLYNKYRKYFIFNACIFTDHIHIGTKCFTFFSLS